MNAIPKDVHDEARRLGETIFLTEERRPVKTTEDASLAREELRVLREIQMFTAKKHGNDLARRLRLSFNYSGPKVETRVSLGPPTATMKGRR